MIDLSVVICFRDWGLDRLALALRSQAESTAARRSEVIVSDYGSADPEGVRGTVEGNGGIYVRTEEKGPWSRSRALNAGVAHARGKYVITTDADMLFTPEALGIIESNLERDPRSVQLVQCRDLSAEFSAHTINRFEWNTYEANSTFRPRWGMGGMIAFPAGAFDALRGYDERMVIYGGEDIDFANRLRRAGYRLNWIDDHRCRIFHVWHESSRKTADETVEGREAIETNRNIVEQDKTWVRNLEWAHRRAGAPPLATVAIATYNRASYLRECTESVLAQSVGDIEIVIIDDGSIDDTSDVVHGFRDSRIRYFRQENAGVSAARNRALAEARAAFLIVQDDDDIMLPWRVQAHFSSLHEGVHGTYGGWVDFDNSSGALEPRPGKEFGISQLLYSGGVMAHGTLMMRVDVLRSFGYREELRAGTDFNLAIRMAMAGVKLRHTGHFHILRRFHGGNLTSTTSDHQKESARKTTNLFRRRFAPHREKSHREVAKGIEFAECAGSEDLGRTVSPHLPDNLIDRMASVQAKEDAVYQRVVAFSRENSLELQVFRAEDNEGQLADRNCCLFGITKAHMRSLREVGIDAHIEPFSESSEDAIGLDAAANLILDRVGDMLASRTDYHSVVLTASGSSSADAIWSAIEMERRLVIVGRKQYLIGVRRFSEIGSASLHRAGIQEAHGEDVRSFVLKAAA